MAATGLFAKRVFLAAGIYGIVALLPQYLMEERVGRDFPPPLTHPEYFYGFNVFEQRLGAELHGDVVADEHFRIPGERLAGLSEPSILPALRHSL